MTDINAVVAFTGASAVVSAAHRDVNGNLHGHTWEVTAWWAEGKDGVKLQQELEHYLKIFDHTVLGENVAWGEALAKSILVGLNCKRVEVRRPLERLYAVAEWVS